MKRKNIWVDLACTLAGEEIKKKQELADKHFELFLLMDKWTRIKQEGKNLSCYFQEQGYQKIAIYGMSYVGKTLINELKDSDIEIICGIDKKSVKAQDGIEIVGVGENITGIDAVIVTAFTYIDEIETELKKYLVCPVISIRDILFEVSNMK